MHILVHGEFKDSCRKLKTQSKREFIGSLNREIQGGQFVMIKSSMNSIKILFLYLLIPLGILALLLSLLALFSGEFSLRGTQGGLH